MGVGRISTKREIGEKGRERRDSIIKLPLPYHLVGCSICGLLTILRIDGSTGRRGLRCRGDWRNSRRPCALIDPRSGTRCQATIQIDVALKALRFQELQRLSGFLKQAVQSAHISLKLLHAEHQAT